MVRVQVALDRAQFRPGKIDGLGGEFTQKALDRYNAARGQAVGTPPEGAETFREYTVTEQDLSQVGKQADTPAAQEKLKAMLYANLWELVAEKFHCDEDFLRELNPSLKDAGLKAGAVLKVPDVVPFDVAAVQADADKKAAEAKARKENPTPAPEASSTPPAAPRHHIVLLREPRILEVYEGDKLVASFPCTPGSEDTPVPEGQLKVKAIAPMPYYRWDKSVLETGVKSDTSYNLPPGPNNPVGIVWIALDRPSIGMHGTTSPDQIGRNQSHGCIRLSNWDADVLRKLTEKGTIVEVR